MLVAGLGSTLGCAGSPAEPMNSTTSDPVEVPEWVCVPGETQPCPCADDLDGLLTCNPDGSAFGECDCSPGAVSQGPPLTSTGSGSGSEGSETGPGDTTIDPTSGGSTTEPDPTTSGGSSGPGEGSSGSSSG